MGSGTRPKQAEETPAGLSRVLEMIAVGAPLAEVLDALVLATEDQAPGMLGSVLLLDADGKTLRHSAAPHLPREYTDAIDGAEIGPEVGSCGSAAYLGVQVIASDIETDPTWRNFRHMARLAGLRACWSTPIIADGTVLGTFAFYYRVSKAPTPDELALAASATHVARIAIERDRAAHALRDSADLYRGLFESHPVPLLVYDTETLAFVAVNQATIDQYGYSREEFLALRVPDLHSPEDLPILLEYLKAPRPPYAGSSLWRHRKKDGAVIDVEITSNGIQFGGRGARLVLAADLTERIRAEADAKKNRDRLELALKSANVGLWDWNLGTGEVYWSARSKAQLGYEDHEIEPRFEEWASRLHPEDRESTLAILQADIEHPRPEYELTFRLRHKDGSYRSMLARAQIFRNPDGTAYRMIGCHLDVTDRLRTQEEHARLARAVEQATDAVVITNPDGTIVYVNPAFERVSEYSREEAIGQNPRFLKSGEHDETFYRQMWMTLTAGAAWTGRVVNKRRDGSLFEEEATISPVFDTSGRVANYVAVKRDVTNEIRLEQQLHQAQKMEAVGRLAGGVAHDFNNILGVISGYGEMVLRKLPAEDPLRPKVDQILRAADRAVGLTRQLLAFSRKQVLQPKVLSLNTVIADTEQMLRRLIGEDVDLVTTLSADIGRVRADPGQVEQVVVNLAVNARDAMPEGGRLTIGTANADLDAAYAASHAGAEPGRYVALIVSDTGQGMNAETRAHIFEPFFTTKEAGKGTGLGLSTVYGIIKQSDGYIWVDSELGVGTTFRIYLPQVEGPEGVATQPPQALPPRRGNARILLVEDEDMLREFLREGLEANGYIVLSARDGAEALQIADEFRGRIDLMVTDLVMPGMTGREAAEQIGAVLPSLKVLYMSGYTDDAVLRRGVLDAGFAFLGKPFTLDALLHKLQDLLDERG